MPSTITLTIIDGATHKRQYVFTERTTVLVGRDKVCHIRFPKDKSHKHISRHHCLIDINPPNARIRDLGSLAGTYVNAESIGKGEGPKHLRERMQFAEIDLHDGDEIKIAKVVIRVSIRMPAMCVDCSEEIPEEDEERLRIDDGNYRCEACQNAEVLPAVLVPSGQRKVCTRCGRDVAEEIGVGRLGDYLCQICRADPEQLARRLLELASSGSEELVAVKGYRIEKELGRGGMGAVYLATHEETKLRVALKVMLPMVALSRRNRDLFLREAELTRLLNQENVVRLFDVGSSQGTFFFTLQYCAGGSLADVLKRTRKPFSVKKAVQVTMHALTGLEYAHQLEIGNVPLPDGSLKHVRGLVHRDIKPQNIFLAQTESGKYCAKLGDYGLAKAFDLAGLSGLSMTGSTAGTPVFMPRQQIEQYRYVKPEVDVWAMAATLYYMLTLRYPRDFPKGQDRWQVVLQTDAIPIRQRDSSIPSKLAKVIDHALIDKPEITFKTATELKQAILSAF